ncbi:MAG: hypothetical protein ACLGI6_05420 [Gammaproteobacteria bacterium]
MLGISLNEQHIASLPTEQMDLVSVRVFGNRKLEQFAVIDADGAAYLGPGAPTPLDWLTEYPVEDGDAVTVHFGAAAAAPSPSMPPAARMDFTPDSDVRSAWAAMPLLRPGYTLELSTTAGQTCRVSTAAGDESLSVVCTWHKSEPQLCRIWVSTRALAGDGDPGPTGNARIVLSAGEAVTVRFQRHEGG